VGGRSVRVRPCRIASKARASPSVAAALVAFAAGAVAMRATTPDVPTPEAVRVVSTPDECRQARVLADEAVAQSAGALEAGVDLIEATTTEPAAEGATGSVATREPATAEVLASGTALSDAAGWFGENVGAYRSARKACVQGEG
jgi:hypothetical protein